MLAALRHFVPVIPEMVKQPKEETVAKCDDGGCSKVKSPPTMADLREWFPPMAAALHFSADEVFAIAQDVISRRPCNFLVFGAGHDTALWRVVNFGGKTIMLESDMLWTNVAKDICPPCNVQYVEYKAGPNDALLSAAKDAGTDAALVKDFAKVVKV